MYEDKECCVCGEKANQFSPSLNTGDNLYYCDTCASNYLENYDEIVHMGFTSNELCKTYKYKTLIPTLNFYKKNISDFDNDVEMFLKESCDEDERAKKV